MDIRRRRSCEWLAVTEAKQMFAMNKSMASLTPTSTGTGVGDVSVDDDVAKAIRLLHQSPYPVLTIA